MTRQIEPPGYHVVRQGEHLSRVALDYGHRRVEAIWDAPENKPLQDLKRNPNVMQPGDRLFIPALVTPEASATTQRRHVYRVVVLKLKLRFKLVDLNHQPVRDAACTLRVDLEAQSVKTNGEGLVEVDIPVNAESAELIVPANGQLASELRIPIDIGHLDPAESLSGQLARLRQLGYLEAELEVDQRHQAFRLAVENFQADNNLTVDGICGPKTQATLVKVHGA